MKKIHLTDGLPVDIRHQDQNESVKKLTGEILSLIQKSDMSYSEINKALYLADKGLYENVITKSPIL